MTPSANALVLDESTDLPYGTSESFGSVYETHRDFVASIAHTMLGPDDAEDGVQEVFLRLFRSSARFEGRAAFRTWLYRVTVNTCINMSMARSRRWRRMAPLDDGEQYATPECPVAWQLDMRAALDTLPARERTVLLMHDWEGYRHSDVARELGMAEGTSKCSLFNARRLLRRSLDGY